jgi:hypothetical protein
MIKGPSPQPSRRQETPCQTDTAPIAASRAPVHHRGDLSEPDNETTMSNRVANRPSSRAVVHG